MIHWTSKFGLRIFSHLVLDMVLALTNLQAEWIRTSFSHNKLKSRVWACVSHLIIARIPSRLADICWNQNTRIGYLTLCQAQSGYVYKTKKLVGFLGKNWIYNLVKSAMDLKSQFRNNIIIGNPIIRLVWSGHVNTGIIFLCIGNSRWCDAYTTKRYCSHLFIISVNFSFSSLVCGSSKP